MIELHRETYASHAAATAAVLPLLEGLASEHACVSVEYRDAKAGRVIVVVEAIGEIARALAA